MRTPANELLALSAPLARRLAPQLCRKDPVSGEDCSWYHGIWQDLRLLGLAATPDQHANFFRNGFARFSGRSVRLLICGAADHSILERILGACSEHRVAAKITVVDWCQTPLFFNRWYAERAECSIETVQADIFNHGFKTAFDVICSHGFLSQFRPAQRAELVRRWLQALVPGGTTLLLNRVRTAPTGAETRFSEAQGREFCETVAENLRQMGSLQESEKADILARAKVYVHRLTGYALTEEELTTVFPDAGFRIDDLQILSSHARDGKLSGPAVPSNANHAALIASRM